MPVSGQAITEFRALGDVSITGAAISIDAQKAAVKLIADLEAKYAKLGAAGAPDLTAATVIKTGSLPYQVHVFTVTTVMANGDYTIVFVESRPEA